MIQSVLPVLMEILERPMTFGIRAASRLRSVNKLPRDKPRDNQLYLNKNNYYING